MRPTIESFIAGQDVDCDPREALLVRRRQTGWTSLVTNASQPKVTHDAAQPPCNNCRPHVRDDRRRASPGYHRRRAAPGHALPHPYDRPRPRWISTFMGDQPCGRLATR